MKNIINDFENFSYIKYEDYTDRKSFPLFTIDNLSNENLKKISNKFYINSKEYILNDLSINDLFTLILDNTKASIQIYKENNIEFLSNSALFLVDFNTQLFREIEITEEIVRSDILQNYSDKYLSEYIIKDIKIFDQYNNLLTYSETNSIIKTNFNDRAFLHLTYNSKSLKVRSLEEFPLTDISQIFLTKEGV